MPGGPVMTPGGGTTGAPLQPDPHGVPSPAVPTPQQHIGPAGGLGGMFSAQNLMGQIGDFRNALQDWRQARPQFSFDPSLGTSAYQQFLQFRPTLQDWRAGRPSFGFGGQSNPGGPIMTPGGGTTGAPLQPPTQVGMVPGVPGSMAINPGSYQLPTYG